MFLSGGIDPAPSRRYEPAGRRADQDVLGRRSPNARRTSWHTRGSSRRLRDRPSRGRRHAGAVLRRAASLVWHEDEPMAHPVERGAELRLAARGGAREGRAHRRGERRDAGRLWPLPEDDPQLARWRRATSAMVPARDRRSCAGLEALPRRARAHARRTFLALPPTSRRCTSTTSPSSRAEQQRAARADAARAARRAGSVRDGDAALMAGSDAKTLLDRLLYVDTRRTCTSC